MCFLLLFFFLLIFVSGAISVYCVNSECVSGVDLLSFLPCRFGSGYRIKLHMKTSSSSQEPMMEFIRQNFPGAELKVCRIHSEFKHLIWKWESSTILYLRFHTTHRV